MELLRLASLYSQAARDANVKTWIKKNVKDPKNNCFFWSAVIALLHPEYDLYKTKPVRKGDTAHFFLKDDDGHILDPTYSGKADYEAGKKVSARKNLGAILKDPLFKQLPDDDQKTLKSK